MTTRHEDGSGLIATGMHSPPRLARYLSSGTVKTGLVEGDSICELGMAWTAALAVLARGDVGNLVGARLPGTRQSLDPAALLPTLEPGSDVLCVGLNYPEHREEASDLVERVTDEPIIFAKTYRAIAAPNAELVLPAETSCQFDWEAELGVVIGRDGTRVAPDEAWELVAGYCVVNDITARDLQTRHQQWHLGKNVAGSTPVGPWVVGRDALPTPPDLELSLAVNGVEKQRGRSSQLIHGIPELIQLLSSVMTLRAGDIIATGTPSGVGFKRRPPEFLEDGNVITTTISAIGSLTNTVLTSMPIPSDVTARTAQLV